MSSPDTRRSLRLRGAQGANGARARRAGFTLIEVLAAVALLGILYAVLARVAIEGLRAEGESERRLEASLLADERVNDLFGAPLPAVGHAETQEGDFAISLDVAPFQVPPQWSPADPEATPPLLLAPGPGGGSEALRTVQLTISWIEGANERHVTRTLYLLDFERVSALAASAPAETPAATGALPEPDADAPPPPPPQAPEAP